MKISDFLIYEDYKKIYDSVSRAINDFFIRNKPIEELIENKKLQKNREFNNCITIINQYVFKTSFANFICEIRDCGRYNETVMFNNDVLIVFKNKNNYHFVPDKYKKEYLQNKLIFAYVDLRKKDIQFEAFIDNSFHNIYDNYKGN